MKQKASNSSPSSCNCSDNDYKHAVNPTERGTFVWRIVVRVSLVLNAMLLLDMLVFQWSDKLFLHVHVASITTKAAKEPTSSSLSTATSGKVFEMKKIRSYPTESLRFQAIATLSNNSNDSNEQQPQDGQQPFRINDGKNSKNSKNNNNGLLPPNSNWPQGQFWNRPHCKIWGAATTIFPPTEAVEQFVALEGGWCLVVAGDRKGPTSYNVTHHGDNLVFLSQERQEELAESFEFVKKTPWNHFARKNIAYLYAIANGAQFIWDFDDDNILHPNETLARYVHHTNGERIQVMQVDTRNNTECGVFNPYPFFHSTEAGVWPRGYPLDKITAPVCQLSHRYCTTQVQTDQIGIYQSLADKDPDVDAVYRLTRHIPIFFSGAPEALPVLVPSHTMSPMNGQATLYSRIGQWSMFLPTTVHGRVSDIWRSYFAQAVGKYCGMLVTFVGPHVVQDRNAHSYLADMEAERQLYDRAGSLVSYLLHQWSYDDPGATLEGAWERLFVDMYEHGIVELDDVELAQLWMSTLRQVGYDVPTLMPLSSREHQVQSVEQGAAVDQRCKDWQSTSSQVKAALPSNQNKRICELDDVVLLGQFNFNTKLKAVLHWVKQWRKVFRHVEVRGPFDEAVVAGLRRNGVHVFQAAADEGWYSPMQNLADSLRLHANESNICGVATAHDDLFINITQLQTSGFPSDDTVFAQFPKEEVEMPYATFYPNGTFKFYPDDQIQPVENYKTTFDSNWLIWWERIVPNITRAVASAPDRERFTTRTDGGLEIYDHAQSDFLYVPTSLAEPFGSYADWMVDNGIFLEIAVPMIVAKLKNDLNVNVQGDPLCTEWNYYERPKPEVWLEKCFRSGTLHGTYHPVKLNNMGSERWDYYFDKIVLGK